MESTKCDLEFTYVCIYEQSVYKKSKTRNCNN